ncbi:MAG: HAD hydrolase-like protein [Elusimicrobia bacterium]|nr:HAD hydrolase-like protein [Elusimicrobiota bacterium]
MKIVLFDIDGTLIKAGGAGVRALNKAIKKMCGVADVCSKLSWQGVTDKANFDAAFRRARGRKPTAGEARKIEALYVKCLPAEIIVSIKGKNYAKIKGAEKLLKKLSRNKGLLIGLGTGNLKAGAFLKLEPSGLLEYFSFGGYGCDSRHRSDVLRKAVERAEKMTKTKIRPGEVFVIGDTHLDVLAAKEAGYHPGAILDGFGDAREIQKSGPEILTKNFAVIKPWLLWLGLERDPKGVRRGTYICPDSPIEHAHYGSTGMDLKNVEDALTRLRSIKRKIVKGSE